MRERPEVLLADARTRLGVIRGLQAGGWKNAPMRDACIVRSEDVAVVRVVGPPRLGESRGAVQQGRRIAAVSRHAGISPALAMIPRRRPGR